MSPEMMRGDMYGPSTDVYSFAIVMTEILRQRAPYDEAYLTPVQVALLLSCDARSVPLQIVPTWRRVKEGRGLGFAMNSVPRLTTEAVGAVIAEFEAKAISQVATAVADDCLRPQLASNASGGLKFLLEMCWGEAELRPGFELIVEKLEEAVQKAASSPQPRRGLFS